MDFEFDFGLFAPSPLLRLSTALWMTRQKSLFLQSRAINESEMHRRDLPCAQAHAPSSAIRRTYNLISNFHSTQVKVIHFASWHSFSGLSISVALSFLEANPFADCVWSISAFCVQFENHNWHVPNPKQAAALAAAAERRQQPQNSQSRYYFDSLKTKLTPFNNCVFYMPCNL